jgi:CBS domain-containing protein
MASVEDVMQRNVITIAPTAPVSELVRLLSANAITGVPVVDEQDRLAGVVSARDVLRLAREMGESPEAMRWGLAVAGPVREAAFVDTPEAGEFFAYYVTPSGGFVDARSRITELPEDVFEGYRVEDIMTPEAQAIAPDATLSELARFLRDRRLHRVLVVRDGRLEGIVTSTDVLNHVAEA